MRERATEGWPGGRAERELASQRSQRARKINFFDMALKNLAERINFPEFTPLLGDA